jgi:NAD/NADP transhydrogenase beta subunit
VNTCPPKASISAGYNSISNTLIYKDKTQP